jgi:oxygen-independent coproporphyrinogen-3 oxidase
VEIRDRFAEQLASLHNRGFLRFEDDGFSLSRDGLLQVDRLLHDFFLPEHRNARYV